MCKFSTIYMVPLQQVSLSIAALIALGYKVLRVIRTMGIATCGTHIETVVQHVGYAVHIQILICCRDLAQCSAHNAQIPLQLAYNCGYLLGIRQDLDATRIGIISYSKGTLYALRKGTEKEKRLM